MRYDKEFISNNSERLPDLPGCWIWLGSIKGKYGGCGKSGYAHRLSYRLFNGEIGDLDVLHRCDNPLCVNPSHLFLGSHSQNMQDMVVKGRSNRSSIIRTREFCKRGHARTPENLYNGRKCRQCEQIYYQQRTK